MNKYTSLSENIIRLLEESNERQHLMHIPHGEKSSVHDIMTHSLHDAKELCRYNEDVIGLENLFSNLYEVQFPITPEIFRVMQKAYKVMNIQYIELHALKELVHDKPI